LKLTILLVDDDPNDLALFGIAVEDSVYDIWLHTASDAHQAIERLEGHGSYADRTLHPIPELVLLDIKMPRADAFDFLAWRNHAPNFSSLPVLIFSDSVDKAEVERAMKMGAHSYLPKPFRLQEWHAAIAQVWELGMKLRTC
jgi:CheY-like chemotaxis protein